MLGFAIYTPYVIIAYLVQRKTNTRFTNNNLKIIETILNDHRFSAILHTALHVFINN